MSNFLEFILEDTKAKRILFLTLPTNTKRNIKRYNEKVETVLTKYIEYKTSIKKYLDTKSNSFLIKKPERHTEKLKKELTNLENNRFLLNPINTYFEKLGFDNLVYEISNYYDNNNYSLNNVINEFLSKFELINIKLTSEDFKYTYYVNKYMKAFFEIKNSNSNDYSELSEIFEKIYWVNPKLIEHIELNFRKIIKKHEKKFNEYVSNLQREILKTEQVTNYYECLKKVKKAFIDYKNSTKEDVFDIINLSKEGTIDPANYYPEAKFRINTFNNIIINELDFNNKDSMEKFYENLEKLKLNLQEYDNYLKFEPLIKDFKKEHEKETLANNDNSKKLKSIESDINNKEKKLEKFNRKIFSDKVKNKADLKILKLESIKKAEELYELYKIYNNEYFKDKILTYIDNTVTIFDLLQLYYSYNYYKKNAIRKVFRTNNPDDVKDYSSSFDYFAMNPLNIIVNGVLLFEEKQIDKVIVNRYRLENIRLLEEEMDSESLKLLIDKIQFLIRINIIENSSTNFEKIWFISQVEKINKKENK